MKAKIHPKWYPDCQVACACGNTFTTGATVAELKVQICSQCHPFFTGEQKFIDTLGKVERFELPNLCAFNFLLHQALGGGGTQTLRHDAQGKTLSTAFLRMEIDLPVDLARQWNIQRD